jgi:hypothetical protein
VVNAKAACTFGEMAEKETRGFTPKAAKKIYPAITSPAIAPPTIASKSSTESPSLDAPKPASSSTTRDPRLIAFIEKAEQFFAKTIEVISAEDREALASQSASVSTETSATTDPIPVDQAQSFRKSCETLITAAIHLPRLEQTFSSAWPATVRYMLPNNEPGISIEQTWSPVIAWVVLRSFSAQGMSAELFDKLLLRSVLGDIFSSLGMEGERVWQTAARVRILLSHPELPSEKTFCSDAFWSDPDVRWLTGVNESSGTIYFNKEQFEEMVCWTQIPALLEIAANNKPKNLTLEEVEKSVAKLCSAAETSGFKLDKLLANLTEETKLQPTAKQ